MSNSKFDCSFRRFFLLRFLSLSLSLVICFFFVFFSFSSGFFFSAVLFGVCAVDLLMLLNVTATIMPTSMYGFCDAIMNVDLTENDDDKKNYWTWKKSGKLWLVWYCSGNINSNKVSWRISSIPYTLTKIHADLFVKLEKTTALWYNHFRWVIIFRQHQRRHHWLTTNRRTCDGHHSISE